MRKFIFSFGVICTVAAAAFMGGCNKNCESCCDKDKAAVQTDAQGMPAGKTCTGQCDKSKCTAGSKCCQQQKTAQ
ncbi:MAG TPA: hypothetical protein VHC70_02935 [Phycisphaerales bacterium]|jgi:hypothetical protein|nr:hypothetical protein [Phycisphaerales bacterium]